MIGQAIDKMVEDLEKIKEYNQKLEKKYLLLSAVVADLLELSEEESQNTSIMDVIDTLYEKFEKEVPEAINNIKNQM
jgi:septation ring formation regulator EzrA